MRSDASDRDEKMIMENKAKDMMNELSLNDLEKVSGGVIVDEGTGNTF